MLESEPDLVMPESQAVTLDLREWQKEALRQWLLYRRGIVRVVTGAGKTWLALAAIQQSLAINPGIRVLIVVPSIALQDQWLIEIREVLGVEAGTRISQIRTGTQILVLVVNSARDASQHISDPWNWFQIVDECHRVASIENRTALINGTWGSLGLSATPERQYDAFLEEVLIPSLGPVIIDYSYDQAINDNVIERFDLTNVEVWMTEGEQSAYSKMSRQIGHLARTLGLEHDRTKAALLARARIVQALESRILVAIGIIMQNPAIPTIVFHEQIQGAEEIARGLESCGVRVAVYHSRRPKEQRLRDLQLFRIGAVDTLICCRALDEGLNVPRAERAIIAASTRSKRQRIQRMGRIVRKYREKATPCVYTLWATPIESTQLIAEEQELQGVSKVVWQSARRAS